MAGNDVDEVADTPRRVVGPIQVDVDAAGRVGEAARSAQCPHQTLQDVNILTVKQNGADQFHAVAVGSGDDLPPAPVLADNAAVVHELPDSAVRGDDLVGVVVIPAQGDATAKILRGGFRRLASGDAGKLDLNAKMVGKHLTCPPFRQAQCQRHEGVHRRASHCAHCGCQFVDRTFT